MRNAGHPRLPALVGLPKIHLVRLGNTFESLWLMLIESRHHEVPQPKGCVPMHSKAPRGLSNAHEFRHALRVFKKLRFMVRMGEWRAGEGRKRSMAGRASVSLNIRSSASPRATVAGLAMWARDAAGHPSIGKMQRFARIVELREPRIGGS
jgi:hypothetical protein